MEAMVVEFQSSLNIDLSPIIPAIAPSSSTVALGKGSIVMDVSITVGLSAMAIEDVDLSPNGAFGAVVAMFDNDAVRVGEVAAVGASNVVVESGAVPLPKLGSFAVVG